MALTKIDDRGLKTPIDLQDNEKIRLGTGNDLELYHDGSHSFIKDTGTGDFVLQGSAIYLNKADNSENMLTATSDGAVELYHNGVKKLETTSTGATITPDLILNNASGDTALRWAEGGTNKFSLYQSSGTLRFYDNTNSAERMRVDSSGRVLIGVTSSYANASIDELQIGDASSSNQSGITIGSNDEAAIAFANAGDNRAGSITYNMGDDAFIFKTDGQNERMRIDSSGNVGIGTTSPQGKFHVKLATDKHIAFNPSQGEVGNVPCIVPVNDSSALTDLGFRANHLNFAAGTGAQSSAQKMTIDDTGVGIGAGNIDAAGLLHIDCGTDKNIVYSGNIGEIGNFAGFQCVNDALNANTGFGIRASEIRFAINSNEEVRIDSDGLKFNGDSAAANGLSDYEEGTWTPTGSWDNVVGHYTKIGRVVHAAFQVRVDSTGSANMGIGGLPFNCANNEASRNGIFWGWNEWDSTNSNYGQLTGNMTPGGNDLGLYRMDGSGGAASYDQLGNDKILKGVICYQTA